MTIMKAQGSTLDVVVVSLDVGGSGKRMQKLSRQLLYVGCSRATKLEGLYLDGKFEAPSRPTSTDPVSFEMGRLRNTGFQFYSSVFARRSDTLGNRFFFILYNHLQPTTWML